MDEGNEWRSSEHRKTSAFYCWHPPSHAGHIKTPQSKPRSASMSVASPQNLLYLNDLYYKFSVLKHPNNSPCQKQFFPRSEFYCFSCSSPAFNFSFNGSRTAQVRWGRLCCSFPLNLLQCTGFYCDKSRLWRRESYWDDCRKRSATQ
jgi:hypothetical protein